MRLPIIMVLLLIAIVGTHDFGFSFLYETKDNFPSGYALAITAESNNVRYGALFLMTLGV
jgi:hypothetical protein